MSSPVESSQSDWKVEANTPSLMVSVSKEESGTWTLGGDNSYSGTTSIVAGTLVLAHPNALGIGAVALGSATGSTTLTAGAALDLNGHGENSLVISDEDAAKLLAHAGSVQNLRRGRVVVLVNAAKLKERY